ncbi:MAG: hypothetical protein JNM36_04165 [Chitinophagales bacterium]|nr:hypothetical protein [Chitinophagales bacterium]
MQLMKIIHFINQITKSSFVLVCCLLSACLFNAYEPQLLEVQMVNEMQGCEEQNLHYTIVTANKQSLLKAIVLPTFIDSLETPATNNLFFSAPTLHRLRMTVKGYYSKKPHGRISDGCYGAHYFKIVEIVRVEQVDDEYSFPIDNR